MAVRWGHRADGFTGRNAIISVPFWVVMEFCPTHEAAGWLAGTGTFMQEVIRRPTYDPPSPPQDHGVLGTVGGWVGVGGGWTGERGN